MNPDNKYEIHMQGGGQKEPGRRSPPPPPERRKDIPAYDPQPLTEPPLTESEPPPEQIEPDEGWDRE